MNPLIVYQLSKERQKDLLREAEHRRLVRQALAGRPGMIARIRERLGNFLIKKGEQLQKRQTLQIPGELGWAEK